MSDLSTLTNPLNPNKNIYLSAKNIDINDVLNVNKINSVDISSNYLMCNDISSNHLICNDISSNTIHNKNTIHTNGLILDPVRPVIDFYNTNEPLNNRAVISFEIDNTLKIYSPYGAIQLDGPFVGINDIKIQTVSFGTSSARPPSGVGQMYYDTTLGYAIWFNGSVWVNASGGVV